MGSCPPGLSLFLILDVNKIKGKVQSKLKAKFDNYVYPQMKTWKRIKRC